jgi:response regulator NasT
MNRSLRIAVADDEPDMREYFQAILPRLGHTVVAAAETGRDLAEQCASQCPDLIITDIKMPDMDGIEAAALICRTAPVPVILVSAHHSADDLRRVDDEHILAYLIKPIKKADLETAITIALFRFEQFQALHRESASLRQALEDRKIIERAKGLLMKKANLDEPEAFRRLQRLASAKNKKLVEIAQIVLTAEEAVGTMGRP